MTLIRCLIRLLVGFQDFIKFNFSILCALVETVTTISELLKVAVVMEDLQESHFCKDELKSLL